MYELEQKARVWLNECALGDIQAMKRLYDGLTELLDSKTMFKRQRYIEGIYQIVLDSINSGTNQVSFTLLAKLCSLFSRLAKRPGKHDCSTVTLYWEPLYTAITNVLFPSDKRGYKGHTAELDLSNRLVRFTIVARKYFTADLSVIKARFEAVINNACINDDTLYELLAVLCLVLPTRKTTYNTLFMDWFVGLWRKLPSTVSGVDALFMSVLCRIAKHFVEYASVEPWICDRILAKLRCLAPTGELPDHIQTIVPSTPYSIIALKLGGFFTNSGKYLAHTIQQSNILHSTLLRHFEVLVHPSYTGPWTIKCLALVSSMTKTGVNRFGVDFREFCITTILPVLKRGVKSKNDHARYLARLGMQYGATIMPWDSIHDLIDGVVESLTMTETHDAVNGLKLLTVLSEPLCSVEHRETLLSVLNHTLYGVDPTDLDKTKATLAMWYNMTLWCTDIQFLIEAEWYSMAMDRVIQLLDLKEGSSVPTSIDLSSNAGDKQYDKELVFLMRQVVTVFTSFAPHTSTLHYLEECLSILRSSTCNAKEISAVCGGLSTLHTLDRLLEEAERTKSGPVMYCLADSIRFNHQHVVHNIKRYISLLSSSVEAREQPYRNRLIKNVLRSISTTYVVKGDWHAPTAEDTAAAELLLDSLNTKQGTEESLKILTACLKGRYMDVGEYLRSMHSDHVPTTLALLNAYSAVLTTACGCSFNSVENSMAMWSSVRKGCKPYTIPLPVAQARLYNAYQLSILHQELGHTDHAFIDQLLKYSLDQFPAVSASASKIFSDILSRHTCPNYIVDSIYDLLGHDHLTAFQISGCAELLHVNWTNLDVVEWSRVQTLLRLGLKVLNTSTIDGEFEIAKRMFYGAICSIVPRIDCVGVADGLSTLAQEYGRIGGWRGGTMAVTISRITSTESVIPILIDGMYSAHADTSCIAIAGLNRIASSSEVEIDWKRFISISADSRQVHKSSGIQEMITKFGGSGILGSIGSGKLGMMAAAMMGQMFGTVSSNPREKLEGLGLSSNASALAATLEYDEGHWPTRSDLEPSPNDEGTSDTPLFRWSVAHLVYQYHPTIEQAKTLFNAVKESIMIDNHQTQSVCAELTAGLGRYSVAVGDHDIEEMAIELFKVGYFATMYGAEWCKCARYWISEKRVVPPSLLAITQDIRDQTTSAAVKRIMLSRAISTECGSVVDVRREDLESSVSSVRNTACDLLVLIRERPECVDLTLSNIRWLWRSIECGIDVDASIVVTMLPQVFKFTSLDLETSTHRDMSRDVRVALGLLAQATYCRSSDAETIIDIAMDTALTGVHYRMKLAALSFIQLFMASNQCVLGSRRASIRDSLLPTLSDESVEVRRLAVMVFSSVLRGTAISELTQLAVDYCTGRNIEAMAALVASRPIDVPDCFVPVVVSLALCAQGVSMQHWPMTSDSYTQSKPTRLEIDIAMDTMKQFKRSHQDEWSLAMDKFNEDDIDNIRQCVGGLYFS